MTKLTVITPEDIKRYTKGQCWVLAWHLNQVLPQSSIIDFNQHVLVKIGDDEYLDVTGVHTKAELAKVWTMTDKMQPIAYDLTHHILPDPDENENVQARRVALALIAGLEIRQ